MRRFGQVSDDRLAGDVLAEREGQFGFRFGKRRRIEDFAQADHLAFRIRQFQTHAGFAGDGFHHADGSHAKRARQVFFKVQNGTAAHADIRLNLVARNDRAGIGVHHFDFNFELGQFFFDGNAVFQQLFFSLRGARVKLRRQKQGGSRQVCLGQCCRSWNSYAWCIFLNAWFYALNRCFNDYLCIFRRPYDCFSWFNRFNGFNRLNSFCFRLYRRFWLTIESCFFFRRFAD